MSERKENISRREMLRGRFLGRIADAMSERIGASFDDTRDAEAPAQPAAPRRYPGSLDHLPRNASGSIQRTIPVHRPPGAVAEQRFLAECTRCDACLEACPHDSIIHAPARLRAAAGTPMIDPARQPCWMCSDYPCIESCEPGVLTKSLPPVMGTARIVEQTCLAHQGSFCSVCSERCPVEGAIEMKAGKPRIVEENCTGCGVCHYVCPAPENAVIAMPAFIRPDAAEPGHDGDHE